MIKFERKPMADKDEIKRVSSDPSDSEVQSYYNKITKNFTSFDMSVRKILYETYGIDLRDKINQNVEKYKDLMMNSFRANISPEETAKMFL